MTKQFRTKEARDELAGFVDGSVCLSVHRPKESVWSGFVGECACGLVGKSVSWLRKHSKRL